MYNWYFRFGFKNFEIKSDLRVLQQDWDFSGIMQFIKLFFPILYKITKLIVFKISLGVCEGMCNQVSSILGRQFYI